MKNVFFVLLFVFIFYGCDALVTPAELESPEKGERLGLITDEPKWSGDTLIVVPYFMLPPDRSTGWKRSEVETYYSGDSIPDTKKFPTIQKEYRIVYDRRMPVRFNQVFLVK